MATATRLDERSSSTESLDEADVNDNDQRPHATVPCALVDSEPSFEAARALVRSPSVL
jgi:hypothetical protein